MPSSKRKEPQLSIEHCRFCVQCTKRWSELEEVAGECAVRFCNECQRAVHRVVSDEEFGRHARTDHCVAIEVAFVAALTGQALDPAVNDDVGA